MTRKLVVATSNAHKTGEIREFLGSGWEVADLSGTPKEDQPIEDGDSFEANALIKARAAAAAFPNALVLSDDSGLAVDVLGGEPGIHSARYAGEDATDADNRRHLLQQLGERASGSDWKARFHCVLILVDPNQESPFVFDGTVEGHIQPAEQGEGGFGYDPLFVPDSHTKTFAELPSSLKNEISHRANALKKLSAHLDLQNSDDRS